MAEEAVTWKHAADFLDLEISQDTEAYLQNGRAHANLTDSELSTLWAAAFSAWFRSRSAEDSLGYYDLDAELELRGMETPLETVRTELTLAIAQLPPSQSAQDSASNERLMNFLMANYSEVDPLNPQHLPRQSHQRNLEPGHDGGIVDVNLS